MKRLTLVVAMLLGVFVHAAVAQASEEAIGLFFDQDCNTCSASIPSGQVGTIYINAARGGYYGQYGLTGAEFRVIGLPPEWIVTSTPNPAAEVVIGDPFGSGTDVAYFPPLGGSCARLFTCAIRATTSAIVHLRVVAHLDPNPICSTSPAILCDCAPGTTIKCASGGEAVVNGGACSVGVDTNTWSRVKKLYD